MKSTLFSTRLSTEKRQLLKQIHQDVWISEREVVEKSLDLFHKQFISQSIIQSFAQLWDDKEMMDMAEEWLEDFACSYGRND